MFLKKSFYLTINEVNSMYIERDFDCTQLSVGGGEGGDSHMKGAGMLVVSLMGVNFGFWSHLGCS